MIKNEKNSLKLISVLVLCIALYLLLCSNWSIPTIFNLVGILCSLIGALWIAAGVILFKDDKQHLNNGKNKNKLIKKMATIMTGSSDTVWIGVAYILFGSIFQGVASINTELNWF